MLPLCCLFVAMLANALHVCVAGYPTTKEKVRVCQSTGRTEGMSRKCIVRSPSVCVCVLTHSPLACVCVCIDPLPSPLPLPSVCVCVHYLVCVCVCVCVY